jgi:hypothetical protein
MQHYDPAYRRSSLKNFARLPEAQVVRVDSAGENAFERLSRQIGTDPISAEMGSVPIS